MKNIDTIRSNQNQRQEKRHHKKTRDIKSLKRRTPAFRAYVVTLKVFVALFFIAALCISLWIYNQTDFAFGNDFDSFDMRLSSTIYTQNEYGEYEEYEQFKSSEKRIWVDIEDVPEDMQKAFVAIEDQRFYSHKGIDLKRTMGAVINVFMKGDSSYGGSTITQQLVKNITQDNERTNARKLREITRALVLETKMDKEQILEMYMNSIYLSQGVHGVQAAAQVYFGKDVSELTLAESACIAGITQYPTTYDPIINPENNKKKQLTVLSKMLELGFITEEEYNEATVEQLVFADETIRQSDALNDDERSYFADFIFEQAKSDLMKEFGYTDMFCEDLLCNGGLKIYATVDKNIQTTMESYYENPGNFPLSSGENRPQSAMVVMDPQTGHIKGLVGGIGEKEGLRVLNRATQSKRQPGSSIKPIGVYAPALEENVINLNSTIGNNQLNINGWTPKNSNGRFSGPVSVQTAVAYSYNIPAINTLKELGIDKSFDYLKNKLQLNSLVDSVTVNGKVYSDKNLASLALGGLTEGVTPLEMTAAYSALANGGTYIEPSSYTKIFDKNENLFYERKPIKNKAFSEETAFLTQELLKNVVKYGTAAGSVIGKNDTCGKTGTTDDNKDKWFIGFTPKYCSGVWFGYDKPRVVSTGTNPSLAIWKNLMEKIHEGLEPESFKVPDGIIKARVCPYTGLHESRSSSTVFANKKFLTDYCKGKNHGHYVGWTKDDYMYIQASTPEEEEDNEDTEDTETSTQQTNPDADTSSEAEGNTQNTHEDVPASDQPPETTTEPPQSSAPTPEQVPAPAPAPEPAPAPAPAPEPTPSPVLENTPVPAVNAAA